MPRGTNPNSLANLKKGKATQFGGRGDSVANEARKKGNKTQGEQRSFAEEMRKQLTPERRSELTSALLTNMAVSPEWYKLGLRMLGELPPEQVEVSKPAVEMAEEIKEALEARAHERQAT